MYFDLKYMLIILFGLQLGSRKCFCELLCEKPDYPQLDKWADYVLETYIEKVRIQENYILIKFYGSCYYNDKRKNNDVEGYNYKLTTFLKVHPNIGVFITKLKSEESAGITILLYFKFNCILSFLTSLKYICLKNQTLVANKRNKVDI